MIYDTEPMIHGGIVLSGEEFRLFSDGSFNGKIEDNRRYLIKEGVNMSDGKVNIGGKDDRD